MRTEHALQIVLPHGAPSASFQSKDPPHIPCTGGIKAQPKAGKETPHSILLAFMYVYVCQPQKLNASLWLSVFFFFRQSNLTFTKTSVYNMTVKPIHNPYFRKKIQFKKYVGQDLHCAERNRNMPTKCILDIIIIRFIFVPFSFSSKRKHPVQS